MALKLGASGIFLKSGTPDLLVQAIRLAMNGGVWVDPAIIRMMADQSIDRYRLAANQTSGSLLEDREQTVLAGIVAGLTNRKIGDNMGLSESNIKNIVQRLFGKAGVKTRSQLVRAALEGSLGEPRGARTLESRVETHLDTFAGARQPA